jgi:hypothetical protein
MSNNQNQTKPIIAIIAIVLATSLIVAGAFDQASARKHNHQSIHQHNEATQTSSITANGGSVTGSGNQGVTQSNTNNGGNAASF